MSQGNRVVVALCALAVVCTSSARALAGPPDPGSLEGIDHAGARRVAESIACTSPQALRYFDETLRHVAERRWGLVTDSLEADAIDLVGDAVYEAAQRGDAKGEALVRFLEAPSRTCTTEGVERARRAIAHADTSSARTKVETCAALPQASRRKDPACSLALATIAALEGEGDTARSRVAEIVTAASFDVLFDDKTLTEPEKDTLFEATAANLSEILLSPEAADTVDDDVRRALRGIDLDEVPAARCKDGELLHDLAEGVLDARDAFCSATRPDLVPEAVEVSLRGPSGSSDKTDLASLMRIVTAARLEAGAGREGAPPHVMDDARVAEALLCRLPVNPAERPFADCAGGTLKSTKAGTFKLLIGGETWAISVAPKGGGATISVTSPDHVHLGALLEGTTEIMHARYDIMALIESRFLGELPKPKAIRPLARAALRIRLLARGLEDARAQAGDHRYMLGILDALPRLIPGPDKPLRCDAPTDAVERARCAVAGSARRLLEDAEDRHTRDVALRVTTLMVQGLPDDCASGTASRLLTAFAAYVPDSDDARGISGHELATEQLRGAARDVASCSRESVGGRRVTFELVPSVALRASWNSAYVNAWGADGFRVAPSLDVLATRVRLSPADARVQFALHASLLDVFAPLVELAMRRPDLDYDRQGVLFIDVVRPRLDIAIGLPSISDRLSVVAGSSLRMAAPFRGALDATAPKPESTATYLTPFSSGSARSERFASFFEANVALKYVF